MKTAFALLLPLLFNFNSEAAEPKPVYPELVESALALQSSLADDSLDDVRKDAGEFEALAAAWLKTADAKDPQAPAVTKMMKGASLLPDIAEEAKLRTAYGKFSEGLVLYIHADSLRPKFQLYYCHMAKDYHFWTQPLEAPMANPYMGTKSKMLTCGIKKKWPASFTAQ